LGAMLLLSALVGWLLHGAARRAVNRARVETALAVDQQFVGRMQRTLLPLLLPHVEHIELEARYHPAHDGARGGDWYAAIPLGEGRVGLAVGEVDGEGAGASARMAEARISLRALAADGAEPHVVLERLNEHLFTAVDQGAPVTAVYGILDAVSRRWVQSVAGECSPIVHE